MIKIDKLLEIAKYALEKGFEVSIKNEKEAAYWSRHVFVKYEGGVMVGITIKDLENYAVGNFEKELVAIQDGQKIAKMLWDSREAV